MHGWVMSTLVIDALVVKHSAAKIGSYASKQIKKIYHIEQKKVKLELKSSRHF